MKKLTFIKRIFSLTFILILAFNAQAKDKFKKGYFIQNGDTFTGYIEYKNWKESPNFIRFKATPESEARIFSPLDVEYFSVANKVFLGRIIDVETSSKDDLNLDATADVKLRKDTVFVEEIYTGSKNLYIYKERNFNEHFYTLEDDKLELLVHKMYYTDNDNGERVVRYNNSFQNQLLTEFGDCDKMFSTVVGASYTKESLKKVFKTYDHCVPDKKKETSKPAKV